jgi:hypothetical protein
LRKLEESTQKEAIQKDEPAKVQKKVKFAAEPQPPTQ